MAVSDFWIDYLKGQNPIRPWDKLILGGDIWPGILAQFTPEVSLGYDVSKFMSAFDAKNGPTYKIRITDKGYEPAKLRAVLQVWTVEQWADLKAVLPKYSPKQTSKTRNAFDITHPACSVLGVKSVIVTRISPPLPINQTLLLEIDMVQWFEGTPFKTTRSSGGALPTFTVDPITPAA
jgi:hypothetical protein